MLMRVEQGDTDSGPRQPGPERLCAATRAVRPVDEMIRFVVGPDGTVLPDLKRNLPGRGLWVTATEAAVRDAVKRKIFARGFRQDVQVRPDLAAFTGELLQKSALDALAIAGKAGQVVTGFAKVEAAIAHERLAALLHAGEASADGVRKLDAALHRRHGETQPVPVVTDFAGEHLDLALGRPNVVHAALLAGPAGNSFIARFQRLQRFRAGNSGMPGHDVSRRKPQGLESE